MKKPLFSVGDSVYYPAKKLKGKVIEAFYADAGDASKDGYIEADEHQRYLIKTARGVFSVKERNITFSHSKISVISNSVFGDLPGPAPKPAA